MNIPLNVSNVSGEEQALQAIKNKQTLQRNPAKPYQQVLKQQFFFDLGNGASTNGHIIHSGSLHLNPAASNIHHTCKVIKFSTFLYFKFINPTSPKIRLSTLCS